MRPPFSIASTRSPEGSSAGALNPVFTKLWGLDLPTDLTTASEPTFQVLGPTTVALGPTRWSVQFEVQGTTSGIHDFEALFKRVVCFTLLSRLPNEGLTEMIETLRDSVEFYRASPAVERQLSAAPPKRALKGKTLERAPLVLEDEG